MRSVDPLESIRLARAVRHAGIDVANRKLELLVSDAELDKRRKDWKAPPVPEVAQRGYAKLYREHVQQADEGCDFDFLAAVRK